MGKVTRKKSDGFKPTDPYTKPGKGSDFVGKIKNLKAARLIIRNLPFKARESDVKEYFSNYGTILEVSLLRKGDKMVGCGFVQFDNKWNAAKAIKQTSGKPFLGRVIVVDWAVAKKNYNRQVLTKHEDIKIEKEIKEDQFSDLSSENQIKEEVKSEDDISEKPYKSENFKKKKEKIEFFSKKERRKPSKLEESPGDGCTLFIRHIPFTATNLDLENCFKMFGEIKYALICIDPITEHSRGTGFVRFKEKKSADACLNYNDELILSGSILEINVALSREKLNKNVDIEKKPKDNRNLYLAKEGVVLPGSSAALGVSNADISKRLELESWKSQKLRNLNMVVSRTRLVIHNLPPLMNNKKLAQIVKQHVPNATLCEVKVMLHLNSVNEKGNPISRGYGYLGFQTHEDALTTLRILNNNPGIFTEAKRPIISFSIENLRALKVKEAQKSQLKNSKKSVNCKESKSIIKSELAENLHPETGDTKQSDFEGVSASLGSKQLFTKYKLKKYAQRQIVETKKIKSKSKFKKRNDTRKNLKMLKGSSQMKPTKPGDISISSDLIEKYKSKIFNYVNRKKWYE